MRLLTRDAASPARSEGWRFAQTPQQSKGMDVPAADWFSGFTLLPLLVFFAELCVVTISTLRIIFISRGMKYLAPLLGFFEITIWLFAIGQVMQNLNDAGCFLGFASGFTLGNFLGVLIEKRSEERRVGTEGR